MEAFPTIPADKRVHAYAENVTFAYKGAEEASLRGSTFSASPGRVTLLCGTSGSGKTSALRLLNGLIPLQLDLALPGLFFSSSIRKRITMKQTLRGYWPTRPGWPFVPASREGPGGVATGDGRRGEG